MRKKLLPYLLLPLILPFVSSASALSTIPQPSHVEEKSSSYELANPIPVSISNAAIKPEALFLISKMKEVGYNLQAVKSPSRKAILLKIDASLKTPESYKLNIMPNGIIIAGADRAGVFYGIQTLLQEVQAAKNEDRKTIPCVEISDTPRYGWRGFMLDEARHFAGKEKVLQLLDTMAYYKFNKFHWHLTDQGGWRIEIKKYPKLTTIGGQGSYSDPNGKKARFYTQDEIREIVKYAAERHIEIIPEIDMPGHATAANKAYPEFSGGGSKGKPDFTFNPGKKETYIFLADILKEVAELFPSKYLHTGGDEVPHGGWETKPEVLALMEKEKLKNTKEVEGFFNRQIYEIVKKLGKTMVGWDELLDSELSPDNTVIMWWRHDRSGSLKKSLDNGFKTILCPRRPLYFDFIQDTSHKVGRTWDGHSPIEQVYGFPDENMEKWNLNQSSLDNIIGIQGNLWTENYSRPDQFDFMIYPRICALAEAAWTPSNAKNFENFSKRMEHAYRMFDQRGIYYYDPREPGRHPEPPRKGNSPNVGKPQDYRD